MYLKQKKISVIGQGFIGLPMSLVLSNIKKNGKFIYKICGIENNNEYGKKIFNCYLKEKIWVNTDDKKLSEIFSKNIKKNFFLSLDYNSINNSDIIILSIGFDFTKTNSLQNLKNLIIEIFSRVQEDKILIIETTLPPGTCDKILIPIAKSIFEKRKLDFNKFSFCYSFERIMPGKNYINSITNINRVYSGNTLNAKKNCLKFLKNFINYKKFKLTCLENIIDAEATKVFENTYRAVNIALIDEWLKFSENLNINLNSCLRAIRLRSSHNNIRYPGLGVGGYCLTKDPLFLEFSAQKIYKKKFKFPITNNAISINKKMISYSNIFLQKKLLNEKNKKILIVGLAYKDSISDIRNSPSIELAKALIKKKYKVYFYDNLVVEPVNIEIKKINKISEINTIKNIVICQKTDFFLKFKHSLNSNTKNYFDLNNVLTRKQTRFIKNPKSKIHVLGGK
jgi:nucleotide sugar dehydrogenase